jgi:tripartite-type tricarboxylate transporter receptor subunit TctC
MARRAVGGAGLIFFALACVVIPAHTGQAESRLPGNYPNKPIRILVGSSPGGGTDLVARLVGQKLAESWNTTVIVENRAGGSGVISMNIMNQAAADGYTISVAGNSLILTGAQGNLPYDIRTAFDAVAQLTSQPYLLVVSPALPVGSFKDLISYATSRPGVLNYGSSGMGSVIHLGTELMNSMAGVRMTHVPYKGIGPALLDALRGQIQMLLCNGIAAAPHLKSGRLKAIAVSTRERTRLFPDLPTIAESGVPGYDLNNMYGVYSPSGLPPSILAALNREFGRIVNSPDVKERLAADGAEAAESNPPAQFKVLYLSEINKWAAFIKRSGIRLD